MLGLSLALISTERVEARLASVRAEMLELEQATGTDGIRVALDVERLRELEEEVAFLEMLAS